MSNMIGEKPETKAVKHPELLLDLIFDDLSFPIYTAKPLRSARPQRFGRGSDLGFGLGSARQQLLLGRGELLVAQHPGAVQLRQLLQLSRQVRPPPRAQAQERAPAPEAPARTPPAAPRCGGRRLIRIDLLLLVVLLQRISGPGDGGLRPPSPQPRWSRPQRGEAALLVFASYDPPVEMSVGEGRLRYWRQVRNGCSDPSAERSTQLTPSSQDEASVARPQRYRL